MLWSATLKNPQPSGSTYTLLKPERAARACGVSAAITAGNRPNTASSPSSLEAGRTHSCREES
jgi:hypothetical protein